MIYNTVLSPILMFSLEKIEIVWNCCISVGVFLLLFVYDIRIRLSKTCFFLFLVVFFRL